MKACWKIPCTEFFYSPCRRLKPFDKDELKKGEIALQTAIGEAKKALALSVPERLAQVTCIPSDEEEDDNMEEDLAAPHQNGVSGTGTKRSRTEDSDVDEDEDDEEVTGRKVRHFQQCPPPK